MNPVRDGFFFLGTFEDGRDDLLERLLVDLVPDVLARGEEGLDVSFDPEIGLGLLPERVEHLPG